MTKKAESTSNEVAKVQTWRDNFDEREQKEISFALDTVAFEDGLAVRPEQFLPGQELRHVIAALAQTLDEGDVPDHFALHEYHEAVINVARHYRDHYKHGTEGHNALMIVAKLADLAGR